MRPPIVHSAGRLSLPVLMSLACRVLRRRHHQAPKRLLADRACDRAERGGARGAGVRVQAAQPFHQARATAGEVVGEEPARAAPVAVAQRPRAVSARRERESGVPAALVNDDQFPAACAACRVACVFCVCARAGSGGRQQSETRDSGMRRGAPCYWGRAARRNGFELRLRL